MNRHLFECSLIPSRHTPDHLAATLYDMKVFRLQPTCHTRAR